MCKWKLLAKPTIVWGCNGIMIMENYPLVVSSFMADLSRPTYWVVATFGQAVAIHGFCFLLVKSSLRPWIIGNNDEEPMEFQWHAPFSDTRPLNCWLVTRSCICAGDQQNSRPQSAVGFSAKIQDAPIERCETWGWTIPQVSCTLW